jgi:hypothetical protein
LTRRKDTGILVGCRRLAFAAPLRLCRHTRHRGVCPDALRQPEGFLIGRHRTFGIETDTP